MFRFRRLAWIALTLCALPSGTALACRCVATDVEGAREGAAAVFEGVVTDVESDPESGKRATLRVVRIWKGDESAESLVVRTASSSAACGVGFEVGVGFLVYASAGETGLFASSCSRTRRSDQAEDDFGALGVGITPVLLEQSGPEDEDAVEKSSEDSANEPDPVEAPEGTVVREKAGFASCDAAATPGASRDASLPLGVAAAGLLAWRVRSRRSRAAS